jgi:hypothetical protein
MSDQVLTNYANSSSQKSHDDDQEPRLHDEKEEEMMLQRDADYYCDEVVIQVCLLSV